MSLDPMALEATDTTSAYNGESRIEDADFQVVAAPSTLLVLPDNCNRGEAVEFMSRGIPTNEYGLPLYYLRSDLLDIDYILQAGHVSQDMIDSAGDPLYYHDGYPTFKTGSPYWTQMRHEPQPAFALFQRFLALSEEEGIRLLDSLSRREAIDIQTLRSYFMEYFWSSRARAYDLFIVAADAKKREARTRKAENHHYEQAGILLEKLLGCLDEEKLEGMDGKELIGAIESVIKIQRLSLGLTGQNASSTNRELQAPAASAEVILRQLTKNNGPQEQSGDSLQNRLALLMADPDTAIIAQELVIRATTGNQVNDSRPKP